MPSLACIESSQSEEASDFVRLSNAVGRNFEGDGFRIISWAAKQVLSGVKAEYIADRDIFKLTYFWKERSELDYYRQRILNVGSSLFCLTATAKDFVEDIKGVDAEWHRSQSWALENEYLDNIVRVDIGGEEFNGVVWGWLPAGDPCNIENHSRWMIRLVDNVRINSIILDEKELVEAVERHARWKGSEGEADNKMFESPPGILPVPDGKILDVSSSDIGSAPMNELKSQSAGDAAASALGACGQESSVTASVLVRHGHDELGKVGAGDVVRGRSGVYEASQPLVTDSSVSRIPVRQLNSELTCPICLSICRSTHTVMECLHRFCQECIEKHLRLGHNECPKCRVKVSSRRALRPDLRFDGLIRALYPDIDRLEAQEGETSSRQVKAESDHMAVAFKEGLIRQADSAAAASCDARLIQHNEAGVSACKPNISTAEAADTRAAAAASVTPDFMQNPGRTGGDMTSELLRGASTHDSDEWCSDDEEQKCDEHATRLDMHQFLPGQSPFADSRFAADSSADGEAMAWEADSKDLLVEQSINRRLSHAGASSTGGKRRRSAAVSLPRQPTSPGDSDDGLEREVEWRKGGTAKGKSPRRRTTLFQTDRTLILGVQKIVCTWRMVGGRAWADEHLVHQQPIAAVFLNAAKLFGTPAQVQKYEDLAAGCTDQQCAQFHTSVMCEVIRSHLNQALTALKGWMYENITAKRSATVAKLLGVPENGDLAVHAFGSDAVCLLLKPKKRGEKADPNEKSYFHIEDGKPQSKFLGAMLRIRRADHTLSGTITDGKTNEVNLMNGSEHKIKGSGLPAYNEIFIGALTAYLLGLSPEGLTLVPEDKSQVEKVMKKEIIMNNGGPPVFALSASLLATVEVAIVRCLFQSDAGFYRALGGAAFFMSLYRQSEAAHAAPGMRAKLQEAWKKWLDTYTRPVKRTRNTLGGHAVSSLKIADSSQAAGAAAGPDVELAAAFGLDED